MWKEGNVKWQWIMSVIVNGVKWSFLQVIIGLEAGLIHISFLGLSLRRSIICNIYKALQLNAFEPLYVVSISAYWLPHK